MPVDVHQPFCQALDILDFESKFLTQGARRRCNPQTGLGVHRAINLPKKEVALEADVLAERFDIRAHNALSMDKSCDSSMRFDGF